MIGDGFNSQKSYYNQTNLKPEKLVQCLASLSSVLYNLLEFEIEDIEKIIPRTTLSALYEITNRDISALAVKHNIDLADYDLTVNLLAVDLFSSSDYVFEFIKQYSSFLKELDAEHINQGKDNKAKGRTKSLYTKLFNNCARDDAVNNLDKCACFFEERLNIVRQKSLPGSTLVLQTLSASQEFCSLFSKNTIDPEKGKILFFPTNIKSEAKPA